MNGEGMPDESKEKKELLFEFLLNAFLKGGYFILKHG
jgi:hypothetical protein